MTRKLVGDLIVARVRGAPTEALLARCHDQTLQIVQDTGRNRVLYDTLEMDAPPVSIVRWRSGWRAVRQPGSIWSMR